MPSIFKQRLRISTLNTCECSSKDSKSGRRPWPGPHYSVNSTCMPPNAYSFAKSLNSVRGFHKYVLDAVLRTAPQRRRCHTGTCGHAQKYNTILTSYGTSAARRWLPQALALPTFLRRFFNGKRLRCGELRYGILAQ